MSCSAPLPTNRDLLEKSKAVARESRPICRYFQIKIVNEQLTLGQTSSATGSVATDFNSMASHTTPSNCCYFVFRPDVKNEWLFFTWVPAGASVKDKMLYSSTKATIKKELGLTFVDDDQFSSKEEINWSVYQKSQQSVSALSAHEIELARLHKEEEVERQSRKSAPAGSVYHSVIVPFTAPATQTIQQLKTASFNFVELKLDERKENIELGKTSTVSLADISRQISSTEPRYYVYRDNLSRFFFIYSCPENSTMPLRMSYSTAKASVVDHAGLTFFKKLEVTESSDLKSAIEEAARASLSTSPSPPASVTSSSSAPNFGVNLKPTSPKPGSSVKSSSASAAHMQESHPVYSLMDPHNSDHKPKKKIVIPPSGAY